MDDPFDGCCLPLFKAGDVVRHVMGKTPWTIARADMRQGMWWYYAEVGPAGRPFCYSEGDIEAAPAVSADALPWAVVTCDTCVRPFRVAPEQAGTWTRCHGCEMHTTGYRQGREDGERRGADRMARAMVAALYWRAGAACVRAERHQLHSAGWEYYLSEAAFLRSAAQAMGLHL